MNTIVYNIHNDRQYHHFIEFERDSMANLQVTTLFKWINEHNKNIIKGYKCKMNTIR